MEALLKNKTKEEEQNEKENGDEDLKIGVTLEVEKEEIDLLCKENFDDANALNTLSRVGNWDSGLSMLSDSSYSTSHSSFSLTASSPSQLPKIPSMPQNEVTNTEVLGEQQHMGQAGQTQSILENHQLICSRLPCGTNVFSRYPSYLAPDYAATTSSPAFSSHPLPINSHSAQLSESGSPCLPMSFLPFTPIYAEHSAEKGLDLTRSIVERPSTNCISSLIERDLLNTPMENASGLHERKESPHADLPCQSGTQNHLHFEHPSIPVTTKSERSSSAFRAFSGQDIYKERSIRASSYSSAIFKEKDSNSFDDIFNSINHNPKQEEYGEIRSPADRDHLLQALVERLRTAILNSVEASLKDLTNRLRKHDLPDHAWINLLAGLETFLKQAKPDEVGVIPPLARILKECATVNNSSNSKDVLISPCGQDLQENTELKTIHKASMDIETSSWSLASHGINKKVEKENVACSSQITMNSSTPKLICLLDAERIKERCLINLRRSHTRASSAYNRELRLRRHGIRSNIRRARTKQHNSDNFTTPQEEDSAPQRHINDFPEEVRPALLFADLGRTEHINAFDGFDRSSMSESFQDNLRQQANPAISEHGINNKRVRAC
ncbi:unnamed protein product [Protopolystoma xenopodis]|uniref:Uncharacterized protein n=1 Tax=Protopolystoma xenopodis TaxID=117903 RepID=A0A448WZJ1_9PLAT|nr:unnamed protein product [Protopolystoma xenopodis]